MKVRPKKEHTERVPGEKQMRTVRVLWPTSVRGRITEPCSQLLSLFSVVTVRLSWQQKKPRTLLPQLLPPDGL